MANRIVSTLRLKRAQRTTVLASVEHLKEIEDVPYDNFDLSEEGGILRLTFEYPLEVFDHSVGQFMAVLFGELAFMRSLGQLTFERLELPEVVYSWFSGPQFGADELMKRYHGTEPPVVVGIIKPSLGRSLSPDIVAEKIREALAGGIHAVKDDEMQGDLPFVPLRERVRFAEKEKRYIPALNRDDLSELFRLVANTRLGMVLINGSVIGFPMLHEIRKHSAIPLLSHVALQGSFQPSFSPRIFAQLHRLFGCDAYITPIGDVDYYRTTKADEAVMVEEFLRPLPIKKTLPLLTGGARLHNLKEIIIPYLRQDIPFGIVLGTQIFASGESPRIRAEEVMKKIQEIRNLVQTETAKPG